DFKTVLEAARDAGAVDLWEGGSGEEHFVGVPGMSAMAKYLAKGLDIQQKEEVRTLSPVNDHWAVNTETAERTADRVAMTVPAPQAAKLLGPAHPLSARLGHVKMAPCLTLMAAFGDAAPVPFAQRRDASDDLSWIACNSDKPGRPGPGCWIAQAGVAWSEKHLELERDDIAALMLPMLCDRIGADPASALFAAAQRWRYAHVATPLGAPFLKDENGSLWLGGDWCLGPRVEAAWDSGTAIANDILGHS
ncbi:MAG: FAD-dependent oxidoreductase, partial [Pseudomonadota bacterium]